MCCRCASISRIPTRAASSTTRPTSAFASGRTDFLRLLGTDARRLIDGSDNREPAAFVVRRMTFDFFRPARMDDLLEVETRVKEIGGASVTLIQTVTRDGNRIAEAEVTVVLISVSGKPLRLSQAVRGAFLAHTHAQAS